MNRMFQTLAASALLFVGSIAQAQQDAPAPVPPMPFEPTPAVTPAPVTAPIEVAPAVTTPAGLTDSQKADVTSTFEGLFNSPEFEVKLDEKVGKLVPAHVQKALEAQLPGAISAELAKQLPGQIAGEVTRQLPGAITPLKKEFAGAATDAMLPAVEKMLVTKGVLKKSGDSSATPTTTGVPAASNVTAIAPAPTTTAKTREPIWNAEGYIDQNGKQWYKSCNNDGYYYDTPQRSCNTRYYYGG